MADSLLRNLRVSWNYTLTAYIPSQSFTALPPYLFSGADFALIPSRDEPFGLVGLIVAVEFGRKGALGVGSRLGGLGLMPGWVSVLSFLTPTLRCYRLKYQLNRL